MKAATNYIHAEQYLKVYGVVDGEGKHTDVSKSLQGAKRYATLNGFDKVSVRFNGGYNVVVLSEKVNDKWINS